jgi:putative membrane protein
MELIITWVLNASSLLAVAYLVPDIYVANFKTALIAALVIGFFNLLIKPILVLLTLPITLLTLGLFVFVINGLLFYAAGNFLQGFEVKTFTSGIVGALLYSILSWLLTSILVK